MGSKRGRLLIRQPRIKKDTDMLQQSQYSTPDTAMEREAFQVNVMCK